MNALPAYLQGQQLPAKSLADTLLGNLGSGSPPSISIRNNKFSAVDSTGAEKPVGGYSQQPDQFGVTGVYVDVVIADTNEFTSKVWFEKPFDPNGDWAPPDCWSDNGIGASRQAAKPQSLLCGSCPKNVWGSEVSKVSGKGIKACHDVQKLAAIVPGEEIIYQLRLPPNSRTNFRDYVMKFKGQAFGLDDVVTRVWFDPQTIGTLKFVGVGFIDEATFHQKTKALVDKRTDALVGRGDLPVQQALPAPTQQVDALPPNTQAAVPAAQVQQPGPLPAQPAAQPQQGVFTAQPGPGAQTAAPSPQPEGQRRRRRTQAQIAADNAAQGQPQQTVIPPQQTAQPNPGPTGGPFATNTAPIPNGAAPQPNNFGMQQGVAPNPEIEATLEDIFGKQ